MRPMRTLIFGSQGQLGRDLMIVSGAIGARAGYDLPGLDITVPEAVAACISDFRPDVVINASAYTDVEAAEDDAAAAFLVNETGAHIVATAAAAGGAPVVYVSTDYVFDGTKNAPYVPGDSVNPLSVYARSKAAGERAVREAAPRHFIVRTAWLYGPGGNNFVEKILRAAASRPSLKVIEDEMGCPTHTLDLARAILALCATGAYGTYHAANTGVCSRYDLARAILRCAGLDTPVAPCPASEFPMKARRPMRSELDVSNLEDTIGYKMRPWPEALADYLNRRTKTI